MSQRLHKLCRVWGFAKYYHPEILKGNVNWDYELFRVLPAVAGASGEEEVNAVLMGGVLIAPFTFTHTGENIVVDGIDADYPPGIETVLPGDIILKTDGIEIWDYIAEKSKIKSRSRDTVVLNDLPEDIFRGYADEKNHVCRR